MKMNQQNQTSNQSLAQILATNQSTQNLYEQYIDCMSSGAVSQTILPPPLFDTNCTSANFNQCYEIQNHPGNYCTLSAIEMPKISSSSSSKRLHRTIPKHFTMSSPSSSAILTGEINQQHQQQQQHHGSGRSHNDNKKPSCQCPVQHVPMTYMQFPSPQPTQSLGQPPMQELQQIQQQFIPPQRHQHSIYMSGSKKHNVIKSTTFPSAMNASSGGKIQTIANAELMAMATEVVPTTSHGEMSGSHISSGGSGTLRRSHKSSSSGSSHNNNNSMVMPTTPNKKSIATISVATSVQQSTAGSTPGYFTPKMEVKHHPPPPQQQQQIHSILKNKNHSGCHVINVTDASNEQNPILPPKMYKTSSSGPLTPGGSKQIHTITRPNELTSSSSQFSLLSINNSSQKYQQQLQQYQQPTQLRTNIQVSCAAPCDVCNRN